MRAITSRSRQGGVKAHGLPRRQQGSRPRPWISIKVELVGGRGEHQWPRPGRIFAAAADHSFADLAAAIDNGFARWDTSHLHEFKLADGTRIGMQDPELQDDEPVKDGRIVKLARLNPGEQFVYVFDLGDDWAHLCTVGNSSVEPVETLGSVPDRPLPYFGWGAIPDQYGSARSADDGETPLPPDPELTDLPPLRPDWGPRRQR